VASLDPVLNHAVFCLVNKPSDVFYFLGRMPNFVLVVQAAEPQPDNLAVLVKNAKRLANEYRVLARLLLAGIGKGVTFFYLSFMRNSIKAASSC
jgi:hypothetical protein